MKTKNLNGKFNIVGDNIRKYRKFFIYKTYYNEYFSIYFYMTTYFLKNQQISRILSYAQCYTIFEFKLKLIGINLYWNEIYLQLLEN